MAEIEDFLEVERTAIWRTKKNYLEKGLDHAIKDNPRSGQPKKYEQKQEAEIIALACSDPPKGRLLSENNNAVKSEIKDVGFSENKNVGISENSDACF